MPKARAVSSDTDTAAFAAGQTLTADAIEVQVLQNIEFLREQLANFEAESGWLAQRFYGRPEGLL